MLFAATYPERTAALALYGLRSPRGSWHRDYRGAWKSGRSGTARFATGSASGAPAKVSSVLAPSIAERSTTDRGVGGPLRASRGEPRGGAQMLFRMEVCACDVRHVLPAITTPRPWCCTAAGERGRDRLRAARYIAEHIPGCTLRRVPRQRHLRLGRAAPTRSSTRCRSSSPEARPVPGYVDRVLGDGAVRGHRRVDGADLPRSAICAWRDLLGALPRGSSACELGALPRARRSTPRATRSSPPSTVRRARCAAPGRPSGTPSACSGIAVLRRRAHR